MKKSVSKNYMYNLIYQILGVLLPLITTPYISRVLGAENIGIYSFTISITAFFILFGSLGVALYGQREIAYLQEDDYKRSKVFWEIFIFRCVTMSISLIVFYITFILKNDIYNLYYKILILEIIANTLDITWFFQGIEEFKKTVGRNVLYKLITLIGIFTLLKTKDDLAKYFVIYVSSLLIVSLYLWTFVPKYIKKIPLKELKIFSHLRPTISLFIPQIAMQVYNVIDKTMIGIIIPNKSEVGYYDQAQKIIKTSLTIITSLGTVMMSRIAITFAKGNKNLISTYIKKSFNLVFAIGFPMIFGIFAVSNKFVPIFWGQGYERVSILMIIISPIILLIGISNIIGTQYLLPTKRQTEYTISVVCGTIVNLITNLLLIWKLGAIGASIGSVMAELTVTSIQIFFTRKNINWIEIIKLSRNYIISSFVMFVICLFVGKFINNNLVSVVLQVVVGCVTYGVMMIIFKDKFFIESLNKIMNMEQKCHD